MKFFLAPLLFIFFCINPGYGAGLRGNGEIIVPVKFQTGRSAALERAGGARYFVTNTHSSAVTLKIYPEIPDVSQLKPGCELIPDASWIKIEKEFVQAGPGETISPSIRIEIPKNKIYENRNYQAYIVSETVDLRGNFTNQVGIKTRLIFSTEPPRDGFLKKALNTLLFRRRK